MARRPLTLVAVLLVLGALLLDVSFADSLSWNCPTGGNWSTASCWAPSGRVPAAGDIVTITLPPLSGANNSSVVVLGDMNIAVQQLIVQGNGTLLEVLPGMTVSILSSLQLLQGSRMEADALVSLLPDQLSVLVQGRLELRKPAPLQVGATSVSCAWLVLSRVVVLGPTVFHSSIPFMLIPIARTLYLSTHCVAQSISQVQFLNVTAGSKLVLPPLLLCQQCVFNGALEAQQSAVGHRNITIVCSGTYMVWFCLFV
jgi:hypothetical protein